MSALTTTELRPVLYLLLNFVVGILVAKGYIDSSVKDAVVSQAANLIGVLIIAATSGVTLFKVIKHNQKSPLTDEQVTSLIQLAQSLETPPTTTASPVKTTPTDFSQTMSAGTPPPATPAVNINGSL